MNEFIKITNFTNRGLCTNCGQCCGDILNLSHDEIKRIDKYLKKHKVEATPICRLVVYDNTCPFRDNKNKICKIYEARPEICRIYKCDKSPKEAVRNRELTNFGKLPRSMRELFFNDHYAVQKLQKIPIFNRKDQLVK